VVGEHAAHIERAFFFLKNILGGDLAGLRG